MRTIAIDFNNPIEYENMVIGNIGEHNATEIILTPPSKIADCEAVKSYIVAFVVGGMVIHSEPFSKTETLSVKLWRQLTEEPVMGIQLEAYDENENFIGKSELISSLRLSPSACGDDTIADTDNPDIISAIAANTSARHSHSNKSVLDRITRANMEDVAANTAARHSHANTDTLSKLGESGGSLTYDGKAVGGSDKIKIKRREFDMRNVGEDFVDGFAFTDIFATNTISFFVKENLPNNARIVDFDIEFNGNIYSSSELAVNDLISFLDEIQIYPSMRYDAGMAAYLAVTIACNDPTVLLYSNIGNEYNLTKLFLYYIDSEVEIIPYE